MNLLGSVVVPDENGKVVSVNLAKENPTRLFNNMYGHYHDIFGGFVVRPEKRLPSQPLSKLHDLRITARDQTLLPRTTLGSFYLDSVDNPPVLCHNFISQAQQLDATQRPNANNSTDSYWLRTLDMAIENAANKKGTRYAPFIDASLFTPDSNNGW
jgi:hypothetical protein